jgi:metallothionein
MNGAVVNSTPAVKCACQSCQCVVLPEKAVDRDGKLYCSRACAYDCTETTCVCVHDRCDGY